MKISRTVILLYFAALLLLNCRTSSKPNDNELSSTNISQDTSSATIINETVIGTGTVKYISIEGGFYGIIGDDGKHYVTNLPPEFQKDSVRIRFEGKLRKDLASIHMWGTPIEIIKIEKL
ncbi:hypothetical protein IIA15_02785 [candidate division TA06 bacterium]|nr:hypothetical protein [candidate division TA06 bacterium]